MDEIHGHEYTAENQAHYYRCLCGSGHLFRVQHVQAGKDEHGKRTSYCTVFKSGTGAK
jgi:hypothetical protein